MYISAIIYNHLYVMICIVSALASVVRLAPAHAPALLPTAYILTHTLTLSLVGSHAAMFLDLAERIFYGIIFSSDLIG